MSRGFALLEAIRYVLEDRGAVWGPAPWWDTAETAFPTVRIPLQPHRWAVVALDTRGRMSAARTADPAASNYRDQPELLPAPDLGSALHLALQTIRGWADRSDGSQP
ncbi:hypothetical protein AB0C84_43475 [Actinomadura sp. NPDC048955]|uniref:hypothetical protein n=1 Tax=Actinomadura sp. NPDC048955 TaxID=3158228 RepID=UPI0033CF353D